MDASLVAFTRKLNLKAAQVGFVAKMLFEILLRVAVGTLNGRGKVLADCLWLNRIVCKACVLCIQLFLGLTLYNKTVSHNSVIKFLRVLFDCVAVNSHKLRQDFIGKLVKSLRLPVQCTKEHGAAFVRAAVVKESC